MKKLTSLIVALLLIFNVFMPVMVYAESSEEETEEGMRLLYNVFIYQEIDDEISSIASEEFEDEQSEYIYNWSDGGTIHVTVTAYQDAEATISFNDEEVAAGRGSANADIDLLDDTENLITISASYGDEESSLMVSKFIIIDTTTIDEEGEQETPENPETPNITQVELFTSINTVKAKIVDENTGETIYYNDSEKGKTIINEDEEYFQYDTSFTSDIANWVYDNDAYRWLDWDSMYDINITKVIIEFNNEEFELEDVDDIDDIYSSKAYEAWLDYYTEVTEEATEDMELQIKFIIYGETDVTVTIPKLKIIDEIEVTGVTTELTVGSEPVFTGKISDSLKEIVSMTEIWDTYGEGYYQTITSNKEQNSYIEEEDLLKKVEDGKLYHYGITFEITDDNYVFAENIVVKVNGEKYEGYSSKYSEYAVLSYDITFPKTSKEAEEAQNKAASAEALKIVEQLKNENFSDLSNLKYYGEDREEYLADIIEQIENGAEVGAVVFTYVSNESALAEKELKAMKEKITDEASVIGYYDINLILTLDGDSVNIGISELANTIKVTVPLLTQLPNIEDGYERVFSVIRLHDGKAEVLPATLTDDGLQFESDKFSIYVPVYEDVIKETTSEDNNEIANNETTNNPSTESEENTNENTTNESVTPKTGDNVAIYACIFVISVMGISVVRKIRK